MAYNGLGVFQRLYSWASDALAGIKISSSRMDAEMDGFATGLSNCITKDGQQTVTANIPMNNKQFTGVGIPNAFDQVATSGTVRTVYRIRNYLCNSNFAIAQRGATVTPPAAGGYGPDRWHSRRDGIVTGWTVTAAYQTTFQSGSPTNYTVKVQRTPGDASVTNITIGQSLSAEDARALLDAIEESTGLVYFYVHTARGVNFSSTTGVTLELVYNLTANANINTAAGWVVFGTITVAPIDLGSSVVWKQNTLTGSWPFPGAYNISLGVRMTVVAPVGVAGADDSISFTAATLFVSEPGIPATFWSSGGINYQPTYRDPEPVSELQRCLAFYRKSFSPAVTPATGAGIASCIAYRTQIAGTAAGYQAFVSFNPPMARIPTVTYFNTASANALWRNFSLGADSGAASTTAGENGIAIVNAQAAGDGVGQFCTIHYTADAEF